MKILSKLFVLAAVLLMFVTVNPLQDGPIFDTNGGKSDIET